MIDISYTDIVYDHARPEEVRVLGMSEAEGGKPGELTEPSGAIRQDVLSVIDHLNKKTDIRSGSRLEIDGKWFRLTILETELSRFMKLRRLYNHIPTLDDLHIQPVLHPFLLEMAKNPGLYLVTGPMRSSKTTFASTLLGHWLDELGGIATTIEEPPEYPLEGKYKNKAGLCMQIPVHDEDWETPFRDVLRSSSRFILVGELLSARAAALAIKAAGKGAAVITTAHASTLQEGISTLVGYNKEAGGSSSEVAAVLKGVFKTRMQAYQRDQIKTVVSPLFINEHFFGEMYANSATKASSEESALRKAIEENNHKTITQQQQMQLNYLQMLATRMTNNQVSNGASSMGRLAG